MIIHDQLKRYIYEQTKRDFFQEYLKEVQRDPRLKSTLAPSITIMDGRKKIPVLLELTSDFENVKVSDIPGYSHHEYGTFPYAVVKSYQDNEFNPQDDLDQVDQKDLDNIKAQSDKMIDPEVVSGQNKVLDDLAKESAPKKKTTRKRRTTSKTTAKSSVAHKSDKD